MVIKCILIMIKEVIFYGQKELYGIYQYALILYYVLNIIYNDKNFLFPLNVGVDNI